MDDAECCRRECLGPVLFCGLNLIFTLESQLGMGWCSQEFQALLAGLRDQENNKEQEVREGEWRDRDHMSVSWSVHSVYSVQLSWSLLATSSSKL